VCTTGSFILQVLQIWKTRSVRDISLGMYIIFIVGVGLWTVFGIFIGSVPVVLANLATLLLAGLVLFAKLRFQDGEPVEQD
jgi:MtN3 and saliva related transmembrane protein